MAQTLPVNPVCGTVCDYCTPDAAPQPDLTTINATCQACGVEFTYMDPAGVAEEWGKRIMCDEHEPNPWLPSEPVASATGFYDKQG